MSEPTLSLTLAQIQAKLGNFAGWGPGTAYGGNAWTAYQQQQIDDATQSGLRRFYYPGGTLDGMEPYDWSFLRPTEKLDLASGAQTIQLPDDFGGWEGRITVLTANSTSQPFLIEWCTPAKLRQYFCTTPEMTGPPMYVASDPLKGTSATAGQRWQLLVFPIADQEYTLQGTYYVNPDYLTTAFPYAYGGPEHIETILESCLAILEERLDDQRGPHFQAFQERLVASIGMDRKKKPQRFGQSIDRSDRPSWDRGDVHYYAPAATYNGQPFG